MKEFACGDVVPGCQVRFRADSVNQILSDVADHARADHGLPELPRDVVDAVRANIREAA